MSDLATVLRGMSEAERAKALGSLSADELESLIYLWGLWARPEQLVPGTPGASNSRTDWRVFLMMMGRGGGKSRSCAEAVRAGVESGERVSIGLIAPTADAGRRDMVSAILAASPPWAMPEHLPSTRRMVWPNGAQAYLLSAEEPDRIRGLNLDYLWGDELSSWSNAEDVWSNASLALRIAGPKGHAPQAILSTTPKRQKLLIRIMNDSGTVVTRASTMANRANLDPAALADLQRQYQGTTLGRQELGGELLLDDDAALWQRHLFDRNRIDVPPATQRRCVIAVDPSGSARGDAVGIVVMATDENGTGYVLADLSGQYSPRTWAEHAVNAFRDFKADNIVAESNFGGQMVEETIRGVNRSVPVKMVFASRGKAIRAAPVASLYEQNRIKHVGNFDALEDECVSWNPGGKAPSPNRLDALVWAATEVMTIDQVKPARGAFVNWGAR